MARLIDAEKLKSDYDITNWDKPYGCSFKIIDSQQTVDAEPVRYGEWIDVRGGYLFECSRCKAQVNSKQFKSNLKYCPECGAKMLGGDENHE